MKNKDQQTEQITISAVDPLNLAGFVLPGPRVTAVSRGMMFFENASYFRSIDTQI